MRKLVFAFGTLIAGLVAVGPSANAAVVASPSSAGVGTNVGFNFSSQLPGPSPLIIPAPTPSFTIDGFTFTPLTGSVEISQTGDGTGAQPFGTSGPYLSVLANSSVEVSFSPRTSVGFFWGSIDPGNTVQFNDVGNTLISGLSLTPGLHDNGCQTDTACNRFITFTGSTFSSFVLFSDQNSFEVTNFTSGVPEPATWAMMILGFLGLGFIGYRKSSKSSGPLFRMV